MGKIAGGSLRTPTVTAVAPVRLVPVMVTGVPPSVVPLVGLIPPAALVVFQPVDPPDTPPRFRLHLLGALRM